MGRKIIKINTYKAVKGGQSFGISQLVQICLWDCSIALRPDTSALTLLLSIDTIPNLVGFFSLCLKGGIYGIIIFFYGCLSYGV